MIHRWSFVAFLQAQVGEAMTGIVAVRPVQKWGNRAKMFLWPSQPSKHTSRDTGDTNNYPSKAVPAERLTRVYRSAPLDPIVHTRGIPSHQALSEEINRTRRLHQNKGDTIGFTILKGDQNRFPTRYVFQSVSSNKQSFRETRAKRHKSMPPRAGAAPVQRREHGGYISHEWGNAIRVSCEALYPIQSAVLQQYGDLDAAVARLSERGDNGPWKQLKAQYWPAVEPLDDEEDDADREWKRPPPGDEFF